MPSTMKTLSRLQEIVGEANLIKDRDRLKAYKLDGKTPKVVVSPATVDETSRVVAYAYEKGLALVPRGNGTKMKMGGIPKRVDILLSTTRLNRITDKDCDNLTLCVESGITLDEVQKTLAREGRGYFLPLDPPFSDKATLGGIVATNASGPKRLLYGTARDLITGMKTVFPNGDVVVSGGKTVKNVSGYDMCKLLIGSFGTLGIICEMTFRLLPLPEKEATLLLSFQKLEQADGFVREIISSQLIPASIETLNRPALDYLKRQIPLSTDGNYLVAIGLEGVREGVERQMAEIGERGKRYGCVNAEAMDGEEGEAFWKALRDFSIWSDPDLISLKSNFFLSKHGEMIASYERMTAESGVRSALICHSGNGILYSHLLTAKVSRSKAEVLAGLIQKMTLEAVKNGGNLIVESAPSSLKKRIDVWGEARSDLRIMQRIKEEMDPRRILNPGRFVGGI
ncbi:MAG: FAD-binding oxidoreductase [Syntrophaceae bacterium]|nr:FAD-binding oxidoreductase [Syntrophaceae bacterium]